MRRAETVTVGTEKVYNFTAKVWLGLAIKGGFNIKDLCRGRCNQGKVVMHTAGPRVRIFLVWATLILMTVLVAACTNSEATPIPIAAPLSKSDTKSISSTESAAQSEPRASTTAPAQGHAQIPALDEVSHWLYLIDVNLGEDTAQLIVDSQYDMVVLDFIPSESNNAEYPMSDLVQRLHNAPHPKLVVAYIDIGQAEDFRTYWQQEWRIGNPSWIVSSDPDGWEGNFPVAFWHDDYRDIWLGDDGYLQAILDAGFDGVYLDWVEAYSDENVLAIAQHDGINPQQEMIWWVGDIAEFTRGQRPGFVVISQNAAELSERNDYLDIIDAISQEHTWFDGGADNHPPGDCPLPSTEADLDTEKYRESLSEPCLRTYNDFPDSTLHVSSEEYLSYLSQAHRRGEIIFTADYALDPDNVAWVYETSRALGFVPFVGNRALDRYVEPVP